MLGNSPLSKGEQTLLDESFPQVGIIPSNLTVERIIRFDIACYDFRAAAIAVLQSLKTVGYFPEAGEAELELESFRATAPVFTDFKVRQIVYRAVGSDESFLAAYESFVRAVVLPRIRFDLEACSAVGRDEPFRFYVQTPPTLRLQPGPSDAFGRTHRDAEYGHQPGEVATSQLLFLFHWLVQYQ
jgi:hypothetical protein